MHTLKDWLYKLNLHTLTVLAEFNKVRHFVMIPDIELGILSKIINYLNV